MILIRDLQGRPVGYLDGDAVRDDGDKVIAQRTGNDADTKKLADRAACLMSDRPFLLDLAQSEVTTGTQTMATVVNPAGEFVADLVCPVHEVSRDRGNFFKQNVLDLISLGEPLSSNAGAPTSLQPGFTKTAFTTTGYALGAFLPRQLIDNADFGLEDITLERICQTLLLHREMRVALLLQTATSFAANNRVAAFAKWNGGVNPTPLIDLFAALLRSALPGTRLVMPESLAPYFFKGDVTSFVQGGGKLPEIVIARAKVTKTSVPAYAWASDATANVPLVRVPATPLGISTAMTLRWLGEDAGADGERSHGMLARKYRDEKADGTWIVVAHNDADVMVDNTVGACITGAQA